MRLNMKYLYPSLKLSTMMRIVELKRPTHKRRRRMAFLEPVDRHR